MSNNEAKSPRPGMEFWDKLNALPRYMFLVRPSGTGVQKLEDSTGNWINVHEAQKVVDAAQEEINGLREELDTMTASALAIRDEWRKDQLRLTAAEQRNSELQRALSGMLFAFDDGVGQDWSEDLLDFARKLTIGVEYQAAGRPVGSLR